MTEQESAFEIANWDDLTSRPGLIVIHASMFKWFWENIQSNANWRITITDMRDCVWNNTYEIKGYSKLFDSAPRFAPTLEYMLEVIEDQRDPGRILMVTAVPARRDSNSPEQPDTDDPPPARIGVDLGGKDETKSVLLSREVGKAFVDMVKTCLDNPSVHTQCVQASRQLGKSLAKSSLASLMTRQEEITAMENYILTKPSQPIPLLPDPDAGPWSPTTYAKPDNDPVDQLCADEDPLIARRARIFKTLSHDEQRELLSYALDFQDGDKKIAAFWRKHDPDAKTQAQADTLTAANRRVGC